MFKAMTMYPVIIMTVWDKWIMPRSDAIPQRYLDDLERWALPSIDGVRALEEVFGP